MTTQSEDREGRVPVTVWDLPTRLFHWSLVILIGLAWYFGETGAMRWHMLCGQTILVLVLFRLCWGFLGSQTARFSDFVKGPGAALSYGRALLSGRSPAVVGHNPLGGLMVVALLLFILIQASTGLFANDDIFSEGPLADQVSKATSDQLTKLHKANFIVVGVLVLLHIAAALFYLLVKKDNLIRPMVTGRKLLDPAQAPGLRHPLWALVVLAVAAALVWQLVTRF